MSRNTDTFLTELHCDVCVVGSGLAGVSAALAAAETQSVVLLSLGKILSGSSFYPGSWGLGLIAPRNDADCGNLAAKIREVGCGMNIPELTAVLVENIQREIERLSDWGIAFRMPEGLGSDRTLIPCFDDSYRMWRGLLYPSMTAVFAEKLKQPAIRTIADEAAVQLICRDNTVYGVISMDEEGRTRIIRSKAVVLATGGTAALFQHAIPTGDISGLGHNLALQAGAQLQNLEFMQFIPAYIQPAYKTIFNERTFRFAWFGGKDQPLLVPYRERLPDMNAGLAQDRTTFHGRAAIPGGGMLQEEYAVRGSGTNGTLPSMQELLESRAMHGPFTSRLPDKIIDFMLYETYRKNGGTPVSFDPAIETDEAGMMIKDYYAWLKKTKGITPATQISIAPFFHAANGGIKIDVHGATGVAGLFACGECSSGMHGADRIGGLSTANSLVFGRRAGRGAADYAAGTAAPGLPVNRFAEELCTSLYTRVSGAGENTRRGDTELDRAALDRIQAVMQQIMYENACIIRNKDGLESAMTALQTLQEELMSRSGLTAQPGLITQSKTTVSQPPQSSAVQPVLSGVPDAVISPRIAQPLLRRRLMLEGQLTVAGAMLTAMLERRESRGSHYRSDYPEEDAACARRILLSLKAGSICGGYENTV